MSCTVITTPPPCEFGWSAKFVDAIGAPAIDLEIEIWVHGAFGSDWAEWSEWVQLFLDDEDEASCPAGSVAIEISALTRGTLLGHAMLVGTDGGARLLFKALVVDDGDPYLPNLYSRAGG